MAFETNLGKIVVSPSKQSLLFIQESGEPARLPFSSIRGLAIHKESTSALLSEVILDFDVWDLDPRFKDQMAYEIIVLDLNDGRQIPVFLAGELIHKEVPFPDWFFDLEKTVLGVLRLYEPIEHRTSRAYEVLREAIWPYIRAENESA